MEKNLFLHPGPAHRDDFLTAAFFAHIVGKAIFRRMPTQEEMPTALMADQGGNDVDHCDHHLPKYKGTSVCSVHLFLEKVGKSNLLEFAKWSEPSGFIDNNGPIEAGKKYGFTKSVLQVLSSPVESAILEEFSKQTEILPGTFWYQILSCIGKTLLGRMEEAAPRQRELETLVEMRTIGDVVFAVNNTPREKKPPVGFDEYIERKGFSPMFSISQDDRGDGWSIFRVNDHPKVDFRKCQDPLVFFKHQNGFVAKIKACRLEKAIEIALQGISE